MILKAETINAYNRTRKSANNKIVCHAPFVNLNFEQNGNVRACCYNTTHILGKWPEQSITEIWEGRRADELRGYIVENNLGGGCTECGKMIESGNHHGVRSKYYDEFAPGYFANKLDSLKRKITGKGSFPRVMEFELSNQCNLECVMCNGYFSSGIRKNREKLPAIPSAYNEKFVDELEAFIPHLTDAKFLGGEPFMIDIYLSIWERILKIKPGIRIHITTNGTFLNNRIKELLEGLNAGIILSIDSVNKETYQKIRVNGNYDKVMENLQYFIDYTKRKNTFISMAVCPIIYNWRELPEMFEFCISKNMALYFNAVFTPVELSLREQPVALLQEIINYLESYKLPALSGNSDTPRNLSISAYNDFVLLLKGWLTEREQLLQQTDKRLHEINADVNRVSPVQEEVMWSMGEVSKTILALIDQENKGYFDEQRKLQQHLGQLLIASPVGQLADSLECFILVADKYSGNTSDSEDRTKVEKVAAMIDTHPYRDNILQQTATAPPLYFAQLIRQKQTEELQGDLMKFFSVQ